MAYSLDFIAHVLRKKKEDNLSLRVAAKRFDVAVCTIQQWEKGNIPKNKRNRLPLKICAEKLQQDVIDYPDAYQRERATRFGVTARAIGYALKRLKITRKKRP